MALDLIELTKSINDQLELKRHYITHVYIAYKVILYYENNYGKITDKIKPKLLEAIDVIYEKYSSIDEPEPLDHFVSQILENL